MANEQPTEPLHPFSSKDNFAYLFQTYSRTANPHCGTFLPPPLWPEAQQDPQRDRKIAREVLGQARDSLNYQLQVERTPQSKYLPHMRDTAIQNAVEAVEEAEQEERDRAAGVPSDFTIIPPTSF